jgi:hypothetical protein
MDPYFVVDPNSRLNWQHDWSLWLAEGDSITARQWAITPLNNTTPETPTLTNATSEIVFVEGLQVGKIYHLSERVTTLNGVIGERTIVLRCDQT